MATVKAIDTGNDAIYMMKFSDDAGALYVIHNYSDTEQSVQIDGQIEGADHLQSNTLKENVLTMQPFSTSIVYLEGTTK